MNTTKMVFRLSEHLKSQIEHVAWRKKLSSSELMRLMAQVYLEKEEKQEGKKAAPVAQQ